jgi:hypothetical protein
MNEHRDVFLTLAIKGACVSLFLLMPYTKCIGVTPIIGMCQDEHCPDKSG